MSDLLWVVKSALLCGYMDLPHFSGVYDSSVLGCKYLELESREAGVYYRALVTPHGSTSNGIST